MKLFRNGSVFITVNCCLLFAIQNKTTNHKRNEILYKLEISKYRLQHAKLPKEIVLFHVDTPKYIKTQLQLHKFQQINYSWLWYSRIEIACTETPTHNNIKSAKIKYENSKLPRSQQIP